MKELSKEKAIGIGKALLEGGYKGVGGDPYREWLGRAAYEAVKPLILAEALAEPTTEDQMEAHEQAMRMRTMEGTFQGGWRACVRFYRERLAKLTAKPDPRIVHVAQIVSQIPGAADSIEIAEEIIAALDAMPDAARKGREA